MASIYNRPDSTELWIACYPQVGGRPVRFSTATDNRVLADRILRKTELLIELSLLKDVAIPGKLLSQLELPFHPVVAAPESPASAAKLLHANGVSSSKPASITGAVEANDQLVRAIRAYLVRAAATNSGHPLADKTSRLRQFFGAKLINSLDPRAATPQIERSRARNKIAPWYKDGTLGGITPDKILEFFLTKNYSRTNKRHFREVFFALFRCALINGIHVPANQYAPNPAAELPSYKGRTEAVTVLSEEDIGAQIAAVASDARVKFAVEAMIAEGFRLHEILVVRREHVATDLSRIQLILPKRKSADDVGLKTGERPITVREEFKPVLRAYLDDTTSDWLVCSPSGDQWNSDGFGEALRKLNRKAGLPWTTQDFRHTFATARLKEGWNLKTLADEMGTSLTMLMEHYIAHIAPPMQAAAAVRTGTPPATDGQFSK